MPEFKEWFVPAASGIAAILGVANVYLNNQSSQDIERLKTQIVRIGEERKFASDIMQRFDNVVADTNAKPTTRISRLEGLMALAGLMTHDADQPGGLDTQGILAVIKAQADEYKSEIAELSKTATGAQADQLQAQYARVSSISASATSALTKLARAEEPKASIVGVLTGAPAAPQAPATTALDRARVDIFWCAGKDQSADALAAANQLLGKRPLTSVAAWRVRALGEASQASGFYNITGQVIRIDSESERPVANTLAALAGGGFTVQVASLKPTPGYVSAFICPA